MEQVHAGLKMQIETNTRRTLDLETERAQLQEEHSKLDNTISGRGRWNDIDQKRTVLGAKLKLLQDKERKLRDKRRDQVRRLVLALSTTYRSVLTCSCYAGDVLAGDFRSGAAGRGLSAAAGR